MFFPNSSIRTRVTYEKGVYLLGGQTILFPTEALDKKEHLQDVFGYLNNWADLVIVRHKDIGVIEQIAKYSRVPVINAMTDINHPCEMLSDIYGLTKIRKDITKDKFLFCGINGNIGKAWKEASQLFNFELEQCCAKGYEIDGLTVHYDIEKAVVGKDIVCTDSLPSRALESFSGYMITTAIMNKANKGAILNPCPPFFRGEEVSEDVIASNYFVGYEFKKYLLQVQQAIMLYCLQKYRLLQRWELYDVKNRIEIEKIFNGSNQYDMMLNIEVFHKKAVIYMLERGTRIFEYRTKNKELPFGMLRIACKNMMYVSGCVTV